MINGETAQIAHRAGVLGDPIGHSLSPLLHSAGYRALGLKDWEYQAVTCPKGELPRVVHAAGPEFAGFSVTMPGKQEALEFATEATDRARAVGVANTLVRVSGGWRADNTDVDGVHGALDELGGVVAGRSASRAVVLGAGGTARAAIVALAERGVHEITVVNRSDRGAELRGLAASVEIATASWDSANLTELTRDAEVLVSTVPAEVADPYARDLGHCPVLDVVYEPRPTALCIAAASNGFLSVGGHVMLAYQAFSQFEQFTGHQAPAVEMRAAIDAVG